MWLEWQANRIVFIRDYRYVDYLLAELPLIELVGQIINPAVLVPGLKRFVIRASSKATVVRHTTN